ncbi:hypothetical protein [Spirulina sp. 06S082]|uniref:hypothetical protein n=1 Tax=Spirulina sp. 06S082 TaxID=3110248 RepID=UPI002B1FC1EA|nr:hypothetical protein [Spirulina sp. 06S082]MEA5468931.1 hypothetical protein [Spirulina sp. 06S082]
MSNGSGLATLTKPENDNPHLIQLMQSYNTDQQIKYLHLEAEVEVLLQQLQAIKLKQDSATTPKDTN